VKIKSLRASQVHGYLPIHIEFFPDLTFLTGLNGSGKTSALRLLMALLTPNLEEFQYVTFSEASVTVVDGNQVLEISATRTSEGLSIGIDSLPLPMTVSSSELQLLSDARRREENASPVFAKFASHEVYVAIKELSTPMFLGIDRRFFGPGGLAEDSQEFRKRAFFASRFTFEEGSARTAAITSLAEVNFLVLSKMQEIRAAQEKLDEDLRRKFFTRAFEYKPSDLSANQEFRFPSRVELNDYRRRLTNVERAADGLRLPFPDMQAALSNFFERMTKVVDSLERAPQNLQLAHGGSQRSTAASNRPKGKKWEEPPTERASLHKAYIEWVINSPQADRILEHLQLLDEYVESRSALREPIDRFLNLVNGFFRQTRKQVEVIPSGELRVRLETSSDLKLISALSSGERQLLVMLAHLSLNPNLAGSGIFIVDEPEISLHIDWQEKFVDAVREANPSVQFILATHSPAIILDREEACWSLS
jgi:predicted ATPase